MYEYEATVVRIVDGDTVDLLIDQGLETYRLTRCRLASINAAEKNSPDPAQRKLANQACDWLATHLSVDSFVLIRTYKDKREKYGRYLVLIFAKGPDGLWEQQSINEQLVNLELAVPYMEIKTYPQLPEFNK